MVTDPREPFGRLVRDVFVQWAREQASPKPSWLLTWDEIDDGQREAAMRIGAAIASVAGIDTALLATAGDRIRALEKDLTAAQAVITILTGRLGGDVLISDEEHQIAGDFILVRAPAAGGYHLWLRDAQPDEPAGPRLDASCEGDYR